MIATSTDHDKAFEIIRDIQLVDLNYRDAQFVRAELSDKIANAIAAAVQAEREACAKVAESASVRHGITQAEIKTGDQVARSIAYKIRARVEVTK